MLSDDITSTINTAGRMAFAVVRGAVRGAVIGAALLVGAAMIAAAAPPLLGMLGIGAATGGLGAAAAGAGHALIATFTSGAGLAALGAAIKLGAIVLGIASIIPGVSDLWSGAKKAVRPREQEEIYAAPAAEQSRAPVRDIDNPYYEAGKGTRLMHRGDNVQGTGACR